MSRLAFGSLFAGIGGFDLGFERAGMTCAWQVEIDDYCRRVLVKHWPDVERFSDVRECGKHNLRPVDVVCGGFPCQPHSLAGKRRGAEDDRDLWPEFIRIVREIEPRWVVAENVPGLLSSESGRFFGRVLRDLAQSGYDAEWDMLPAGAFGVTHLRSRVFVVAYADYDGEPIMSIDGEKWDWLQVRHRREDRLLQEPRVDGVDDGIPNRTHRLRALGNAIIPDAAEWIGRQIVRSDKRNG